jgi:hypothetical protein
VACLFSETANADLIETVGRTLPPMIKAISAPIIFCFIATPFPKNHFSNLFSCWLKYSTEN